jgi:tRNA C32,U32 (ribose-2'-O)-methylase TrmJ
MTASVLLERPKYPHNTGQIVRAMSCFGHTDLNLYVPRFSLEGEGKGGYRLPREERMRDIYTVDITEWQENSRPGF